MVTCINVYYLRMWFDIIKDNNAFPCLVVDAHKTERTSLLNSNLLNSNGIACFKLNESRLYSEVKFNTSSGYIAFDYLDDGIIYEVKIPSEAVVAVYSKAAKIHSAMFSELLLFHSDDGVLFDMDDAETDAKPYKRPSNVVSIAKQRTGGD